MNELNINSNFSKKYDSQIANLYMNTSDENEEKIQGIASQILPNIAEIDFKVFLKSHNSKREQFFNEIANRIDSNSITDFDFVRPKHVKEDSYHRQILALGDQNNRPLLYLKQPNFYLGITANENINSTLDELAYLLSHSLSFNIVPKTLLMNKDEELLPSLKKWESTLFTGEIKNAILQEAIEPAKEQNFANADQIMLQKAILFNLIIGRHDGRRDNSLLDENGQVWEIDNEDCGNRTVSSWLFQEFGDLVISPEVISTFSKLNESDIEKAFKKFEKFHKDKVDPVIRQNIILNFQSLKQFFSAEKPMTVQECGQAFNRLNGVEGTYNFFQK